MTAGAGGWVRFEIEPDIVRGANTVRHRVVVTKSLQDLQPKVCNQIKMTARSGRKIETLALTDQAVGEVTIALGRRSYEGSDLTVTIRQSAESAGETFVVRHAPGQPLQGGCRLATTLSDLDAWRYLASHPEVAEKTGTNLEAVRHYYQNVGRYEGHFISFNPLAYLASHADLASFGEDEPRACEHYIIFGHREGRTVTFDPLTYLALHADVAQGTQNDEREATLHYLRFGRQEGRAAE